MESQCRHAIEFLRNLLARQLTFRTSAYVSNALMPTLGAHFSDDEAKAVEIAAGASPERRVSPYVAEAIRQRMAREGMLRESPTAQLHAAAEEVGGPAQAVEILRRARRNKAQPRAVAAA